MIIKVKVKPNSKENSIKKLNDERYLVQTKEKAIKGNANLEVIKILTKEFGVSFRSVKIKNPRSTNKIIEIIK